MNCNKCGACCRYLKIKIDGLTQDGKEWLLAHENIVIGNGFLYIMSKCKMLKENNECGIYSARFECCKQMQAGLKDCFEAIDLMNIEKNKVVLKNG